MRLESLRHPVFFVSKKSGGSISKDKKDNTDKRVKFINTQAIYQALLDGSLCRNTVLMRSAHCQQYTDKRKHMYKTALKMYDIFVLQQELQLLLLKEIK